MPLSDFDSPPLIDNKSEFRQWILKLHQDVYGLGDDETGTLNVDDNLSTTVFDPDSDQTITGEWTFDTHPLGLLHSLIGDLDWVSSGHVLTDFIAGAGLTGGGTIAADRTFNVGAGTGITVNANSVEVDVATLEPLIDHSDIDELEWSVAGHIIDADIDMNNNSITELNNVTFNDGEILGSDGTTLELDLTSSTTDFNIKTTGNANTLFVDESLGRVGVATNTPNDPFDISVLSMRIGDNIGGGRTDATTKIGLLWCQHYTNAEEPVTIFGVNSGVTTSSLIFGGGTSFGNTATNIQFNVAANNTTTIGTNYLSIDGITTFVEFNPSEIDINFGINASGVSSAFFVQGSDGFVGIQTSSPQTDLSLPDNIQIGWGNAADARIYFDNTNLVIQSDAVGVGAVKTTAGRIMNTTRLTSGDSPYTVLATDHIIICDTDGGGIEVDLTAGVEGKEYRISNVGSSGNDVTVDPDGTEEVFSGGAGVAFVMTDTEGITINFNATEGWW